MKRILLLPFLHIRNVLMRSLNPTHEYFTTILRRENDEDDTIIQNHYVTMSISDLYVQVFSVHGL